MLLPQALQTGTVVNYLTLRSQEEIDVTHTVSTEEELNNMTIIDLKNECARVGIKKSGRKADVIRRLLEKLRQ